MLSGNTLLAGGDFLNISGVARSRVAALDVTTGAATAWDPTAFGSVNVVVPANGKVFVGGQFNGVGGQPRKNTAAFSLATGQPTAWAPQPNTIIQTLIPGPNKIGRAHV